MHVLHWGIVRDTLYVKMALDSIGIKQISFIIIHSLRFIASRIHSSCFAALLPKANDFYENKNHYIRSSLNHFFSITENHIYSPSAVTSSRFRKRITRPFKNRIQPPCNICSISFHTRKPRKIVVSNVVVFHHLWFFVLIARFVLGVYFFKSSKIGFAVISYLRQ